VQVKRETLELAQAASEQCLKASSYSQNDIDLLVYSGVYRDDFLCEPAIASMVAGVLKINDMIASPEEKKTLAFDLFNGAVGFLNACYASIGMIRAKKAKNAMIVASEIENNRDILPSELRGVEETGSAVILDESPDGKTGFGNFVFTYFTDYIQACAAYTVQRGGKTCLGVEKDPHLETYYLQCIPDAVRELLRIERLDISQIQVILPPQISSNFIAALSDKMNLSRDKFVDIVRERSDLFTSSVPYALQYVREQQLVKPGDIGLIISAGSGIQVGCATYYF
jgi:3-oxoacyl-[acyl-carrier-protein] synthase III